MRLVHTTGVFVVACWCATGNAGVTAPPGGVPVIYTSDLYHPHDDPDDHYDLVTLFAIPEFDIRAVVFDLGRGGASRPGIVPLRQVMEITGRSVPYAGGLTENLRSVEDPADQQPAAAQAGVAMILEALERSHEPVTVVTAGSLRDVAAAYNRQPQLFKAKVARLYVNAGHSAGGEEWNVKLDPKAYVRMLRSGLPVYWLPCFGEGGYQSLWKFEQGEVLNRVCPALQNFFVYALSKASPSEWDPKAALTTPLPPPVKRAVWAGPRNMWCTAGFLHAAGRAEPTFTFTKVGVSLDDSGVTRIAPGAAELQLLTIQCKDPGAYAQAMRERLGELFSKVGRP